MSAGICGEDELSPRRPGDVNYVATPAEIAVSIVSSEAFLWLMVGSNHADMQIAIIREKMWPEYLKAGGKTWGLIKPDKSSWEYGFERTDLDRPGIYVVSPIALTGQHPAPVTHRRRPAGPWEPIPGTKNDNGTNRA